MHLTLKAEMKKRESRYKLQRCYLYISISFQIRLVISQIRPETDEDHPLGAQFSNEKLVIDFLKSKLSAME